LFFCDEGRSSREAALFGYFLALLPKSNSPVGEKPRLQIAKAERRVTTSMHAETALDSRFRALLSGIKFSSGGKVLRALVMG